MEMIAVQSRNVVEIGYDIHSQTLVVAFKNGIYQYAEVPEHIHAALMEAPSKGQFVNTYIKNQYHCEKIG